MNIIEVKMANGTTSTHIVTHQELLALITLYESAGLEYNITRLVD